MSVEENYVEKQRLLIRLSISTWVIFIGCSVLSYFIIDYSSSQYVSNSDAMTNLILDQIIVWSTLINTILCFAKCSGINKFNLGRINKKSVIYNLLSIVICLVLGFVFYYYIGVGIAIAFDLNGSYPNVFWLCPSTLFFLLSTIILRTVVNKKVNIPEAYNSKDDNILTATPSTVTPVIIGRKDSNISDNKNTECSECKEDILINDESGDVLTIATTNDKKDINCEMKFCRKCGTKLVDGAAFCLKCGAKII